MIQELENSGFLPTVTVAIPALNEKLHIERVIFSFKNSAYPFIVQILVADGGSVDGTREIVLRLSRLDPRIQLVENPDVIQSGGLNRMLLVATGYLFLRADAHCDYSPDYVQSCVRAIQQSGAVNVGGSQRYVATCLVQMGIALAARSALGSGGAKYRMDGYEGFADTVFLGCYVAERIRTIGGFVDVSPNEDAEINSRIGAFDNEQITNQDAELNVRINRRCRGVYISRNIHVWYYPRHTWRKLFKQYYCYGGGRFKTIRKHGIRTSIRGSIPFAFASLLIALCTLCLAIGSWKIAMAALLLVFLLVAFASLFATIHTKQPELYRIWRGRADQMPGFLARCASCALAMISMNVAHAIGFAFGMSRLALEKPVRPTSDKR